MTVWECTHCGATNMKREDIDIRSIGDDPPEVEWHCPECGSTALQELHVCEADNCTEQPVKGEEYCWVCLVGRIKYILRVE